MTREERNNKLKHFITCIKCEVSGKCCDENCPIQYGAGNMGEIIENLEEISKILEQEPCEDAISRRAVLDYMKYLHGEMPEEEFVKALPSVTPARKKEEWISCDEKLPKPNELADNVRKYYLIQDEYGDMHVASYLRNGWISIDSFYTLEDDVIAWMPLPEPYKAEEIVK